MAAFFGVSTLGTLLFIVAYFAIKPRRRRTSSTRSACRPSCSASGLGLALFCIGAGAIHWAKTLMPDDEIVSERKPMRSSDEDRAEAVAAMKEGAAGAGLGRRKLIRNSLLGALAPLGLLAIIPLRDLGPLPGATLTGTCVEGRARRLVTDPTGRPIKAADIPIGDGHPRPARGHRRTPPPAQRAGQGHHARDPARAGRDPGPEAARLVGGRASSPTPRSARTSAARSACTSSRRTTCSARATSRPST